MTSKTVGEIAGELRECMQGRHKFCLVPVDSLAALLSALESQTEEDGTHTPAGTPEGEGITGEQVMRAYDELGFTRWTMETYDALAAALNRTTKEPS